MPYQNTIDPYGWRITTKARGAMMGNRGLLHNRQGEIVREFGLTRWICCELQFKGRKGPVMAPGLYTRLFFRDEATALAAGHRPCAECRRAAYNAFRAAWSRAFPAQSWPAPAMDAVLHRERLGPRPLVALDGLPAGCIVHWRGQPHYVQGVSLRLWSPGDVAPIVERPAGATARLLTPESIVQTLRHGYTAHWRWEQSGDRPWHPDRVNECASASAP